MWLTINNCRVTKTVMLSFCILAKDINRLFNRRALYRPPSLQRHPING